MIGVFDSGSGGLTVLREIRKRLPDADIIYFGDIENAPYGNKSASEIATLIAMALRRLAAAGAADIVSACNSASVSVHSMPIDLLRIGKFNVVEMVGPTVEALAPLHKKIVLLGTAATVRSGIYQKAFRDQGIAIEAVAVPELAGLIESGAPPEKLLPVVHAAALHAAALGAEIVSLSCTHFPFVRDLFEEYLREAGSAAQVFDPAEAVAAEVARRFPADGNGTLHFLVSKESPVFKAHVRRLFAGIPHTIEPAGSIYWALKNS